MSLSTNLVAYWKFDESSGNASDSSGNGNTLTNNNTVTYTTGKINNCATFGSSDTDKYFQVNSALSATSGGAYSVSMWVNINTDPASNSYFIYDVDNTNIRLVIWYLDSSGTKTLRFYDSGTSMDYNTALTVGTWYHIVITRSASKAMTLYLNGSSVASGFTGGSSANALNRTVLGGASDSQTSANALCKIDETGAWSRALSSTEVTQLYNSGNGLPYSSFTNDNRFSIKF